MMQDKQEEKKTVRKYWKPMSTAGKFIILIVADTFLCNDFEYSLRISQQDFSFVCNDSLFEGNILRFRALASMKLFQYAIDQRGDPVGNFYLLTQALQSLSNAF